MTRDEMLAIAKPILFSTPMVRAILDGCKSVTRRVVKFIAGQDPTWTGYIPDGAVLYGSNNIPAAKASYQPGNYLYVRETWCECATIDSYLTNTNLYAYKADFTVENVPWKWRPSIHMPKKAARLFLRVTDVRVERLRPMGFDEFEAEGLPIISGLWDTTARYANLWDSTIKPADLPLYGWEANPWVWVIDFEHLEAQ